ncbi:MAG TPA: hypothetical protein VJC07_03085 [Candidatus Nanoarchaeia archaeon]|nr:hypothetical protein [Candidatus Nanoarchaeia archaeon]
MLKNETTAELVKEIIEQDLHLLELLQEDVINIMALARKLFSSIKKQNAKATIASIAIAIKRYIAEEKNKAGTTDLKEIIENSQLSTKNDIIHITLERNSRIIKKLVEISTKIRWEHEEVFFVNEGAGEVTVILDAKNKELFKDCAEEIIETTTNLAILSIRESTQKTAKKSLEVPGVYHYFIGQLSRRGINIVEIMSTLSQLTFVLKSDDIMKAYNIIHEGIEYFRKNR